MSRDAHRFTLPTTLGDAEATRDEDSGIWTLATPWGDTRFHGTKGQARAKMAAEIRECDEE